MWELHLPLLMLAQLSLNKARPDKVITRYKVSSLLFHIQAAVKRQFHKGMVMLKLALKVNLCEPLNRYYFPMSIT